MPRYLITGATRGIGRVLVDQLAPEHDLIVVGRSAEALAELPATERIVADLSAPGDLAATGPRARPTRAPRRCGALRGHGRAGRSGRLERGRLAEPSDAQCGRGGRADPGAAAGLARRRRGGRAGQLR